MYKDDNMISGACSEALLRKVLGGSADAPSCPLSYPRQGSCSSCEDNKDSGGGWGLGGFPLASVYAPLQVFEELYDAETALSKGTIFKQLDLPFMGMTVKGGNCCG